MTDDINWAVMASCIKAGIDVNKPEEIVKRLQTVALGGGCFEWQIDGAVVARLMRTIESDKQVVYKLRMFDAQDRRMVVPVGGVASVRPS